MMCVFFFVCTYVSPNTQRQGIRQAQAHDLSHMHTRTHARTKRGWYFQVFVHNSDLVQYDEQAELWRRVHTNPQPAKHSQLATSAAGQKHAAVANTQPPLSSRQQRERERQQNVAQHAASHTGSRTRPDAQPRPKERAQAQRTQRTQEPQSAQPAQVAASGDRRRGQRGSSKPLQQKQKSKLKAQVAGQGKLQATPQLHSARRQQEPKKAQSQSQSRSQGKPRTAAKPTRGTPSKRKYNDSGNTTTATPPSHTPPSAEETTSSGNSGHRNRAGSTQSERPPPLVVHLTKSHTTERLGFSLKTVDGQIIVSHIWKGTVPRMLTMVFNTLYFMWPFPN